MGKSLLVPSRLRMAFGQRTPGVMGLSLAHPGKGHIRCTSRPEDALSRWRSDLESGLILRAEGAFETCGVGLFLTGRHAGVVAAALLQDLITDGVIESGLYVMVEDYLASERPDGDRVFSESIWSDVLVLAGLGTERRTDFARETVEGMLSRRFDRGLPTIVASSRKMRDMLPEDLSMEAFRQIAIMEVSREED